MDRVKNAMKSRYTFARKHFRKSAIILSLGLKNIVLYVGEGGGEMDPWGEMAQSSFGRKLVSYSCIGILFQCPLMTLITCKYVIEHKPFNVFYIR